MSSWRWWWSYTLIDLHLGHNVQSGLFVGPQSRDHPILQQMECLSRKHSQVHPYSFECTDSGPISFSLYCQCPIWKHYSPEWPSMTILVVAQTFAVVLQWNPALYLQCRPNPPLLGWLGPWMSFWPWTSSPTLPFLISLDTWSIMEAYVGMPFPTLPHQPLLRLFLRRVTSLCQSHTPLLLSIYLSPVW